MRTPIAELLQNLLSRGSPVRSLKPAFGDLARTALDVARPRKCDLLVSLFEARQQVLSQAGAFAARQPQHLSEEFVGRHDSSLALASWTGIQHLSVNAARPLIACHRRL